MTFWAIQFYRCEDCDLYFGEDYKAYKLHYRQCPEVRKRIESKQKHYKKCKEL